MSSYPVYRTAYNELPGTMDFPLSQLHIRCRQHSSLEPGTKQTNVSQQALLPLKRSSAEAAACVIAERVYR